VSQASLKYINGLCIKSCFTHFSVRTNTEHDALIVETIGSDKLIKYDRSRSKVVNLVNTCYSNVIVVLFNIVRLAFRLQLILRTTGFGLTPDRQQPHFVSPLETVTTVATRELIRNKSKAEKTPCKAVLLPQCRSRPSTPI